MESNIVFRFITFLKCSSVRLQCLLLPGAGPQGLRVFPHSAALLPLIQDQCCVMLANY